MNITLLLLIVMLITGFAILMLGITYEYKKSYVINPHQTSISKCLKILCAFELILMGAMVVNELFQMGVL